MDKQAQVRVERDSLGEVRVPGHVLYGAQTQRAVENFPVSGLRPWRAFTERCLRGLQANRAKAEGWLEKNAIVVTALNPLIGYSAGAALVKEALERDTSVRQVAVERAGQGRLVHRVEERPVTAEEVEAILSDLWKLTEGGML
jgi:aspartate ammonia-lyase